MPNPFNYTLQNVDPAQSMINALQIGAGINQVEQAKSQAAIQEQMNQDFGALADNPTPEAIAQISAKYPHLSEDLKRVHGMLSEEQKNSKVQQASQVYSALQANEPEIAQNILEELAVANENSGDSQEAKVLRDLSKLIELNPNAAQITAGTFLAANMGADKFTETFTKLQEDRRKTGLEEAELTEKQSKAYKAAVDADFADSNAAADLRKKGWDILKIQEDIKIAKENSKIAALNANLRREQLKIDKMKDSTQREQNQLRLQEMQLKLQEMENKRDSAVREKVANVEAARSNIDNMMNTVDRIVDTPLNVIENATGPIDDVLPTFRQSTADFEELVKTVDAQAFLAQIPNIKGMGALSNAEGEKLAAALQNFSLRQSPEQLMKNMKEAQRLLLKARKNLADRNGLPETIPDRPEVETSPVTTGTDIPTASSGQGFRVLGVRNE